MSYVWWPRPRESLDPHTESLTREMIEAMETRRLGAVLLESDGRYSEILLAGYAPVERPFDTPYVFMPLAGSRIRPEVLRTRR